VTLSEDARLLTPRRRFYIFFVKKISIAKDKKKKKAEKHPKFFLNSPYLFPSRI